MSPLDAAKLFRENADAYLAMTGFAMDERQRRLLHELFEENEARAELLEADDAVARRLRSLSGRTPDELIGRLG